MRYKHLIGTDLIYFVEADVPAKLVKIGVTTDLGRMLSSLRNTCPCSIAVLGILFSDRVRERKAQLHRQFIAEHAHGEWFRLSDKLRTWICDKAVSPESNLLSKARLADRTDIDRLLVEAALEPLIDIDRVAKALDVSVVTVRRYVRAHDIPFIRVGRQLRFYLGDFARITSTGTSSERSV